MLLDAAVLALLALAALHGAMGGALKQVVQLGAAVVGWIAARSLGPAVAAGLARSLPGMLARPVASALLFFGAFALVTLLGAMILRATSLAQVLMLGVSSPWPNPDTASPSTTPAYVSTPTVPALPAAGLGAAPRAAPRSRP